MWAQTRYSDYRSSDFFGDGRAMQPPVEGTVPRERPRGSEAFLTGRQDGKPVAAFPLRLDETLLAKGRHDFDVFCATCHGRLGDGHSQVADAMALRKPPAIAAHAMPPGEVFQVVTEGYGFMPSFAPFLPVQRRWGVVAYLAALHHSQHAPLAAAPKAEQARLREERR
jgi:mono/diheme cytochrome c family protein